ncbi:hypothetical protein ACH47Z_39665 [Streptomyces sp. NPDC020192]|uniref:hypothetical protein n=1 Tax=Streptomyces sp. NPDC020192 TaxID=3365066 RepID=UPI00379F8B2E
MADEVVGNHRVLADLEGIDDARAQAVVALTIDDYTQAEIRQLLAPKSVRAIEGVLYGWRKEAQEKAQKEAQEDEGGGRHGEQ